MLVVSAYKISLTEFTIITTIFFHYIITKDFLFYKNNKINGIVNLLKPIFNNKLLIINSFFIINSCIGGNCSIISHPNFLINQFLITLPTTKTCLICLNLL